MTVPDETLSAQAVPAEEPPSTSTYIASPDLQWDVAAEAMAHGLYRNGVPRYP